MKLRRLIDIYKGFIGSFGLSIGKTTLIIEFDRAPKNMILRNTTHKIIVLFQLSLKPTP